MVLRMDEGPQPDVSSGGQCDLAPHPLMGCSVNIGTSLCPYGLFSLFVHIRMLLVCGALFHLGCV